MDIDAALNQGRQMLNERRTAEAAREAESRQRAIEQYTARIAEGRAVVIKKARSLKDLIALDADFSNPVDKFGQVKDPVRQIIFDILAPSGTMFALWDYYNSSIVRFCYPSYHLAQDDDDIWCVKGMMLGGEDENWQICLALAEEAENKRKALETEAARLNAQAEALAKTLTPQAPPPAESDASQFIRALENNTPRELLRLYQSIHAVFTLAIENRGGLEE